MTAHAGVGPGHQVLGRYEIVRHIATGGMGTVWEARDRTLDQVVALKHVSFGNLNPIDAEQSRLRTLREARFAAQLRGHHRVVAIYDVQEVDGDVWLVLEYLPSRSLAEITRDGETIEPVEAARIGAAVAEALAAAHERGIIHRDIKPGNVLLSLDGRQIKLTDFGISHAEGEHPLTSLNVLSGTPAYMAPEVARGETETAASDVFSLGATLVKIVEGRPPFGEEGNHRRLLQRVSSGLIDPPRRAGPLTPLIMHLLELDPNTRPDAAHTQRLLDDFGRRSSTPTHPPTTAIDHGGVRQGPWHGVPVERRVEPTPPPAGRSRRKVALIGAAALMAVAVLTGGLVFLNRTDPTAVPEIPTSVSAVLGSTGDPRTADPCALLDPVVMNRFGQATRPGPGDDIGECRVRIAAPSGQVFTDAHFSTTRSESSREGARQDLGGLQVVRAGMGARGCESYLVFPDGVQVGLQTRAEYSSNTGADLCGITEAAVAVAIARLAESGVVHTPGWQGPIDLVDENACQIIDTELAQTPDLNLGARTGYPNGAYCFIGSYQAGKPYVAIRLGLEPAGDMSGYGTPATVGGKTVYTSAVAPDSPNPNGCVARVVHKASYDGGLSGPSEYIGVTVEGSQKQEDLCTRATQLAVAADKNASS